MQLAHVVGFKGNSAIQHGIETNPQTPNVHAKASVALIL